MDLSKQRSGGVRSEINVTPLVDVCLVLLIIFMVVTPLLGDGAAELPETSHPAKLGDRRDDVVVTIRRDRTVLIDDKPIAAAALRSALHDIHENSAARQLVVRADRSLAYNEVRDVLRAANEGGFSGAGLATKAKTVDASLRRAPQGAKP